MVVREYFVLNRSDRAQLNERLRAALARWQGDWCASVDVGVEDRDDKGEASVIVWQTGWLDHADMAVAVGIAEAPAADALLTALLGRAAVDAERRNAIAAELRQAALRAFVTALFQAAGVDLRGRALRWDTSAPPSREAARGFATARCRVRAMDVTVVFYPRLTHGIVRAGAASGARNRTGLQPRRAALAAERIVVDVCVGEAELALPELATLAVGDVLCLDRSLEQPALVKLRGGAPLCTGHLGLTGEHKAVQLTILHDNEGA